MARRDQSTDDPNAPPDAQARGNRPPLSAGVILSAAFDVVASEGFEALTMRRVAGELGIGAMTPYTYFRGREELVAALLNEVLGTISLEVEDGTDWQSAVRVLARSHRTMLARFPSAIPYFLSTPATGRHAVRFGEVLMREFRRAGLDDSHVAGAFFALLAMNYGFAAFEARRRPTHGTSEDARRRTQVELATLPQDDYPITVALSGSIADLGHNDAQYEFGLDLFIAGLESRLKPPRRRAASTGS